MRARDLFVCGDCFEDPGLVEFIGDNASAEECSFCATRGEEPIAAPMHEVSEHFIECLLREYDLAVNALGWTGSEGGYFGMHWGCRGTRLRRTGDGVSQRKPRTASASTLRRIQ